MEKELDQLSKDNPNETVAMSDLDIGPSRTKRRRKTVQELQETIDRAKGNPITNFKYVKSSKYGTR